MTNFAIVTVVVVGLVSMAEPKNPHTAAAAHTAALVEVLKPSGVMQAVQKGLKIVVIEGEDAVNIIQQKTAVSPVVEVRDENDLPVGGVLLRFSIRGNRAVFRGGLQELTATT